MSDNIISFAKQVGEDIADIFKRFRPSKERVLAADEDLNTLLEKGVYNATFNMVDWQAQNYPGNLKGYIVVEKMETVNYITQYFYSRSNLNVPYIAYRFMLNAGWSPWVQIQPTPDPYQLDTSVGTRVFAGDQMIYGNTGVRKVEDLASGMDFSGSALRTMTIRRVGDEVTLEGAGVRSVSDNWVTGTLPLGFRPRSLEYRADRGFVRVNTTLIPIGNPSTALRISTVGTPIEVGTLVEFTVKWTTADAWPTSLPGTPA